MRPKSAHKRLPVAKMRFTFDLFKRGALLNKVLPKRILNILEITGLSYRGGSSKGRYVVKFVPP